MKFFGIIPARYQSSRLPGKPLAEIRGKSMIQRVYERAVQCPVFENVVVATDNQQIAEHLEALSIPVIMTGIHHPSGTDRCFEAAQKIGAEDDDVIVNIQGDEPFIEPQQIELIASLFKDDQVNIGTLIKKIDKAEDLENTAIPKVVTAVNGDALLFSRTCIPFLRDANASEQKSEHFTFFKHIGMYAYRMKTLSRLTALPLGKLEAAESLEQLRWLENGFRIRTAVTTHDTMAVDTPEDLERIRSFRPEIP